MKLYEELEIIPIFAPVYSPELNPIEYVFNKLKNKVKLLRLSDIMRSRKRDFNELVPIEVGEVKKEDVNNCIEYDMIICFKVSAPNSY